MPLEDIQQIFICGEDQACVEFRDTNIIEA